MKTAGRYVAHEITYKNDTFLAFSSRFDTRENFDKFYESLNDATTKDEFLRVASSYLFFVKKGDWHVEVERSNPVVDYITNSFKLFALFSLIESLSDKKPQDFYEWLTSGSAQIFPINDKKSLSELKDAYKADYGAIRRCKSFFENLPQVNKDALCEAVRIDGKRASSVTKVIDLLYNVRSEFAHETNFVLEVSSVTAFTEINGKRIQWNLPITMLLDAFEVGVLVYFKNSNATANEQKQK